MRKRERWTCECYEITTRDVQVAVKNCPKISLGGCVHGDTGGGRPWPDWVRLRTPTCNMWGNGALVAPDAQEEEPIPNHFGIVDSNKIFIILTFSWQQSCGKLGARAEAHYVRS